MRRLANIVLCAVAVACGSPDPAQQAGVPGGPVLVVAEPMREATLQLPAGALATAVRYTVSDFTLKPVGSCGALEKCGHVHVLVDEGAGGESTSVASPAEARFDRCKEPSGEHAVAVVLHDDRHKAVKGADGKDVAVVIKVIVKIEGARSPTCAGPREKQELKWECRSSGDAKVELKLALERGELKVELKAEHLPAHTPLRASIDVEGDGKPEVVIEGVGSELKFERRANTCATHLNAAVAVCNFCRLDVRG